MTTATDKPKVIHLHDDMNRLRVIKADDVLHVESKIIPVSNEEWFGPRVATNSVIHLADGTRFYCHEEARQVRALLD